MFIKLQRESHIKVKSLIHSDYLSIQLESVINDTNPGFIYVDSTISPKTAIVYHQGEGGFYFIGDHENIVFLDNIISFMRMITNELSTHGIHDFEFSGDSKCWDNTFKKIFYQYDLSITKQRVYLLDEHRKMKMASIDEDIKIEKISHILSHQEDYKGLSFIIDDILEWWYNLDDYVNEDIGFVATRNNKIIGRCVLDCKSDKTMAIGIAVKDKYQNRKIASTLVHRVVEQILDKGYTPYWECMDDNIASIKLAEKCGLKLAFTYNLFCFSF